LIGAPEQDCIIVNPSIDVRHRNINANNSYSSSSKNLWKYFERNQPRHWLYLSLLCILISISKSVERE
jgi:hypothetical protein